MFAQKRYLYRVFLLYVQQHEWYPNDTGYFHTEEPRQYKQNTTLS